MGMRTGIVALVAALATGWHASPRAAPPDASGDPVWGLLVERGVISPAGDEPPARWRDRAADLVLAALNFLGVPYQWGGDSLDSGFDCSGFTRHVFALSLGLVLPRRSDEQAHAPGLVQVPREELAPGDLVFFNTLRRSFSHVGIYIGDGRFVHAPRRGAEVRVEDMGGAYWATRYNGARRAALVAAAPGAAPVQP